MSSKLSGRDVSVKLATRWNTSGQTPVSSTMETVNRQSSVGKDVLRTIVDKAAPNGPPTDWEPVMSITGSGLVDNLPFSSLFVRLYDLASGNSFLCLCMLFTHSHNGRFLILLATPSTFRITNLEHIFHRTRRAVFQFLQRALDPS